MSADRLVLPVALEDRLRQLEDRVDHLSQLVEQVFPAGDFCPAEGGHLVHVRVPPEHRICARCIRVANGGAS